MGKLLILKYAALCVLGGEIAFTVCMVYGRFLTGKAAEMHTAIFQMLPGYSGMNFFSWLAGAGVVAVWSGAMGAYVAWMHNVSISK